MKLILKDKIQQKVTRLPKPGARLLAVANKLPKPSLPPRPAVKKGHIKYLLATALITSLSLTGGYFGARIYESSAGSHKSVAQKQQYVSDEGTLIAAIAKKVGQSVVSIDAQSQTTSIDIFGRQRPLAQESAGTGFIIDARGIIVTNRHVVPTGTSKVGITLADGTQYDNVQVIGRTFASSTQDIAFLKIPDLKNKVLLPVALGDSSKVQVGDKVIAIGNALGQFQNTVTSGIISGFGRDVTAGDNSGLTALESLTDLFQTDAAINQGNSGGPLVNINGEVIGINTAIASNAQNIGFAQPINDVKGLIDSILTTGSLQQPFLGVRYVSLTDDIAFRLNLLTKRGAYVVSKDISPAVVPASPASNSGIKEEDIITKVNSTEINEKMNLTTILSRQKVGDKIRLTIVRGEKTIQVEATLGVAPSD